MSSVLNEYEYSKTVLIQASIFVILFNNIYLIVRSLLYKTSTLKQEEYIIERNWINIYSLFNAKKELTNSNKILGYLCIFLLVGMFAILFNILGGFSGASWGKYLSLYTTGGYGNIALYFVYIFYAISGIGLAYFKNGYFMHFIFVIIFLISTAIITNTKMMFLSILLIIILPFIFNKKRKISLKIILSGVFSSVLVLYVVNFFYILRTYANFSNLSNSLSIKDINIKILNMVANSEGELGVRKAFYLFIENGNNFPGFNEAHTYIRMLLMFIPTSLSFGIKPPEFTVTMGSAYMGDFNNTIYSMHPTIYGDVFANFGWLGILWGVFWAVIIFVIDKYIMSKKNIMRDMLVVLTATCYVMIGRGSIYNSMILIVVGFVILTIFDILSRVRLNKKDRRNVNEM